jgi:putative peptidoglycan lipid II flippase
MWVPVINNLVVIASGIAFDVVTHVKPRAGHLTHTQTMILAIGTTAGVIAQTVALLPALRRVGFRLKARWDWRGAGFRRAGPFAGWMFGYVLTNQVGFLFIVLLATSVSKGRGVFAAYTYAYVLFSLPYAVVAVTVITALFPGMSRSGLSGDEPAVASTLAQGLSVAGVMLVPATVLFVVAGPPIAVAVFQHGQITPIGAHLIGRVLVAFSIGLVPFSTFQMQLRAWLAVHNSRTPMMVNLWATAVNLAIDVTLYLTLPNRDKAVGLALGYSLSYVFGTVVFSVMLRRRMAPTQRTHVIRTYVRLALAGLIAAVPADLVLRLIGSGRQATPLGAGLAVVVAAAVGLVVFVLVTRRLRVRELDQLLRTLPGRAQLPG